jgi:hypothetical protein
MKGLSMNWLFWFTFGVVAGAMLILWVVTEITLNGIQNVIRKNRKGKKKW